MSNRKSHAEVKPWDGGGGRVSYLISLMNSAIWGQQCFKDLGQKSQARRMCEAACSMDTVSKEVRFPLRPMDVHLLLHYTMM